MIQTNQRLTVPEVSAILRVTEWRVRELLRAGAFPNARRPGRSWLVPQTDIDAYMLRKQRNGAHNA